MFELDGDGRFVTVTEAAAERFGTAPERLCGRYLIDLVADADAPALRSELAAVRRNGASGRQTCELEATAERTRVEIELLSADDRTEGHVVGTVRSGGESRHVMATSTERQRFRRLFELVDDPAVEVELVGTEPVVRAVNDAFESVFAYDADRLVGSSLNDHIIPDEHEGRAAGFDERTAKGKINHGLVTRQTATGPRKFRYRGIPYDDAEGTRYAIAIYSDVHDRRRDRKHLKVLRRVLRHNLRNELTVILGNAEEIREQAESTSVEGAADRILDRARNLVEISDNSRTVEDALTDAVPARELDIGSLVRTTAEEARETHSQATISTDIAEVEPTTAPAELREVVAQLLDNAVVHNDGTPSVRVTVRQYTPIHAATRVSATGQQIVVTVSDDGPGIPKHERDAVFHDDEITQLSHGSGLGLWMVRWVVESAGGRLDYQRADGWTNIEIRLPVGTDERASKIPAE